MKKTLSVIMVAVYPLLRSWIMSDFLFNILFYSMGFKPLLFIGIIARVENPLALITVPLIWLSFYLPFLFLFSTEKLMEILIIFTKSLSVVAIMGFVSGFILFLGIMGHVVLFTFFFGLIVIPVFIVETVLLSFKIDNYKNIGFLKSFGIATLSFLIFPFLLVLAVQMVFAGRGI